MVYDLAAARLSSYLEDELSVLALSSRFDGPCLESG